MVIPLGGMRRVCIEEHGLFKARCALRKEYGPFKAGCAHASSLIPHSSLNGAIIILKLVSIVVTDCN